MDTRKNEPSDLERKRGLLLYIGIALALVLVIMVLEISKSGNNTAKFQTETAAIDEELLQIPITKPIVPPAPPKPKTTIQELVLVDDNKEITEKFTLTNVEVSESFRVEIPEFIDESMTEDNIEFVIAEVNPQFPGGTNELLKYLAQNIRYPALARETGIEGKVYVRFLVTKEGKIERVSIARGVHELLDNEAVRVVSEMPAWTPGKQNGRNVNVWFTVPIKFQLSQ